MWNDVISSKLLDFSREEIKFTQISAQCTAHQSRDYVQCENQIYEICEASLNSNKKSDVEKIKHRRKRVDTGMVKRIDQVIRDLIREIKRIYKRCFYDATDYLKLSQLHSLQQLHQSLVAFVYNNISQTDSEQIAFALGWMAFPMKISDMIHKNCFTFIRNSNKSIYEQMLATIQRPFKRFNSKNLRSFINWGDIATVLIHFPEICVPFTLSEDEAVGLGMIEDECMTVLTSCCV